MTTLISKTSAQGKALVIDYINGEFIATVDGTEVARHRMPGVYMPAKQLHIFGGRVGITKDEGKILIAAERAYVAALVMEPSRADLVAAYGALIDDQENAYTRAHDRQDARAMAIRESYDTKIEAARAAIEAYDAAHPEETAQRSAERAAQIESNRWM